MATMAMGASKPVSEKEKAFNLSLDLFFTKDDNPFTHENMKKHKINQRDVESQRPELQQSFDYNTFRPNLFIPIVLVLMLAFFQPSVDVEKKLIFEFQHWNEFWRFLTYALVEDDLCNVMIRIFIVVFAGWTLEREQNGWRVMAVWCASSAGGALGVSLLQSPSYTLFGASAPLYGLAVAHFANLVYRFGFVKYPFVRVVAVLSFLFADVAFFYVRRVYFPNVVNFGFNGSSNYFGAIFGALTAFATFTGEHVAESMKYEKVRPICRIVILFAVVHLVTFLSLLQYYF